MSEANAKMITTRKEVKMTETKEMKQSVYTCLYCGVAFLESLDGIMLKQQCKCTGRK